LEVEVDEELGFEVRKVTNALLHRMNRFLGRMPDEGIIENIEKKCYPVYR
jgi:hypothetical protein